MYRTYFKRHVTFSKFCVLFSLVLVFFISINLLLVILCHYDKKTYFIPFTSVSIVDFEQVNVSWVLNTPLNIINIRFEFLKQNILPLKRGTVLFSSFREMTSHPCHPHLQICHCFYSSVKVCCYLLFSEKIKSVRLVLNHQ